MFEKTDKRRIYFLMDQYLLNAINGEIFCCQYHNIFALEVDYESLDSLEEQAFLQLNKFVRQVSLGKMPKDKLYDEVIATKESLFQQENSLYERIDKKRIYWLINQYLLDILDAPTFCNEFYACFDLELDYKTLLPVEESAFLALSIMAGRFSPYEGDIKKYPGTYFTEKQLHEKVLETKVILEKNSGLQSSE